MKKYFDLVLDLLELEEKAELLELAERLSEASERGEKVVIAHRYAFLLNAWLKLCSGEIEPEEFVLIGDVNSAFPLLQEGQETSKDLIEKLKTWFIPDEELIIIDERAWKLFLTPEEKVTLEKIFTSHKKVLIAK